MTGAASVSRPAPSPELEKADGRVLRLVPADFVIRHLVLPLRRSGRRLTVAMADPSNLNLIDDLKFITRFEIDPVAAGEYTLRQLIDEHYGISPTALRETGTGFEAKEIERVEDTGPDDYNDVVLRAEVEEEPVVRLINSILRDAVRRGASDVSVEPYEREVRVRYRLDGKLREIMRPPFRMTAALTSRLKILADLNIAERRLPQDGRMKMRVGEKVIDFRVSTLPTLFGERIALRILDKGRLAFDLEAFGMEERAERVLLDAVAQSTGMILVTGPTGSGKTTTLYSALTRLNTEDVNIMTAEDPVEYSIRGINQVQIRSGIGLTFASTLRAFLRQDPNIVMVGEIRDSETGGIAVKAALTGHLVLSTLHTNDAASTTTRLVDMGIEAFNVAPRRERDHRPAAHTPDLRGLQGRDDPSARTPALVRDRRTPRTRTESSTTERAATPAEAAGIPAGRDCTRCSRCRPSSDGWSWRARPRRTSSGEPSGKGWSRCGRRTDQGEEGDRHTRRGTQGDPGVGGGSPAASARRGGHGNRFRRERTAARTAERDDRAGARPTCTSRQAVVRSFGSTAG